MRAYALGFICACSRLWKADLEATTELTKILDFKGELHSLCSVAYEFRKSKSFAYLTSKVRAVVGSCDGANLDENVFAKARHYIGRLGSHMTAAKTLVETAEQLPSLFDDFDIEIVPRQASSLPPACLDDRVNLDGILKRMTPSGSDEEVSLELRAALQYMNEKHNLESRVREMYESKNFQPQVHAELTLLEYFYKHDLAFVHDDRYIGCSKPACYCCWLYIRAHPGRFAEPACHSKIYLNWKPPSSCDDESCSSGEQCIHLRDILNEMVKTVRADAKAQIVARSCRRRSHPDSTTGITRSMDRAHLGDLPRDFDAHSQTSYSPGEFVTDADSVCVCVHI